jgi:hypothetical protein
MRKHAPLETSPVRNMPPWRRPPGVSMPPWTQLHRRGLEGAAGRFKTAPQHTEARPPLNVTKQDRHRTHRSKAASRHTEACNASGYIAAS